LPFSANGELLISAYGTAIYKCPNLRCSHFENGFTTRNLRDTHYQRHKRPFKCENEECDYSAIGFTSKSLLARHVRLCHEPSSDQPIFPKISRCPIDKALYDAIDKEDTLAVRTLATELLDLQNAPAGFLLKAVETGKRESARILIEILGETKEMDYRDSVKNTAYVGNTALHRLVQKEDEALVSLILATSVTVNTERQTSWNFDTTALQIAVYKGSVPIVKALLQHRHGKRTLAANKASRTRNSILSLAIAAGNGEVLQLLLEKGWELFEDGEDIVDALNTVMECFKRKIYICGSLRDKLGTLLVWARVLGVEARYPKPYIHWILPHVDDMVAVFLEETTIDEVWEFSRKKCEDRIQHAILEGDVFKVNLLLRATGVHYISHKHGTVLAIAALYGKIDIVRQLISDGEDIHRTVNNGNSALENAAAGGSLPTVQLLLHHGANVNDQTGDLSDGTALQCAAANGHDAIVGFLLSVGAKIEMHGNGKRNWENALIKAVESSFESAAQLLLAHGADMSAKSLLGESVLHVAAKRRLEKFAIHLMASGAAVDELTTTGDTVLMIAAENGMEELTSLLLNIEIVREQIDLQGEGWIDSDGYRSCGSALFRAASNGHFKVVELLLQAGVATSHKNKDFQTLVMVAKQKGHNRIIDILRHWELVDTL
jgi:ankyrin repeat protein